MSQNTASVIRPLPRIQPLECLRLEVDYKMLWEGEGEDSCKNKQTETLYQCQCPFVDSSMTLCRKTSMLVSLGKGDGKVGGGGGV